MLAASDRLEFVPPPTPGMLRAFGLAILAHAFLLAALTWGVQWKHDAVNISVEAELWSVLPQQSAPKPIEVPPEAPAEPARTPEPVQALPEPPKVDIAIEQEKLRLKKQREKEIELQRQQKLNQEKQALEKKHRQEKLEKERKAAEDKKMADLEKRRKEELQAKLETQKLEAMRKENLNRMAGLAGANGAPDAKGVAPQSSAPSKSYAGRVSARIKPNIVFTEDIVGNPVAEVDVRLAPNGTILNRNLIKSSGVKAWDDAVLKAIDKTERLPLDNDGRVPGSLIIGFRPKD